MTVVEYDEAYNVLCMSTFAGEYPDGTVRTYQRGHAQYSSIIA